jgi:hypothetical protein
MIALIGLTGSDWDMCAKLLAPFGAYTHVMRLRYPLIPFRYLTTLDTAGYWSGITLGPLPVAGGWPEPFQVIGDDVLPPPWP